MSNPLHHARSIRRAMTELPLPALSASERAVLVGLMVYSQADGSSVVTRARLALFTGLSESTVKRCLQRLRDEGLLGAPVARLHGDGVVRYHHPLRLPVEAVLEAPGSDLQEEFWKAENERLAVVQKAFDQVPF